MKKLSYSEMKEVKGGACSIMPSCLKWDWFSGVCTSSCFSGGSGYSGAGSGSGGDITPYYP
jgi:hypothetical protein